MRLVGEACFLQHDADLDAVGRGQRVELDALRVSRRPLAGDGEGSERRVCVGHEIKAPARFFASRILACERYFLLESFGLPESLGLPESFDLPASRGSLRLLKQALPRP